MTVTFFPNTGMEIGWCLALDAALTREGWIVAPEVPTGLGRQVDMIAYLGGITLVIEVKGRTAGAAAVDQLAGYLDDVRQHTPHAIGILAAPGLAATVSALPSNSYFLPLVRA